MDDTPSISKLLDFAVRHRRALAIGGVIWFWAGVAVYTRFIQLPEFLVMFKGPFFWASVAGNALWWAAINPAIDKRAKSQESAKQQDTDDQLESKSEQT